MSPTTTGLLLEATGVSKSYGAVVALKSASLAVQPGEVHALMGANGAGKSTLVKILTGAVRPDSGRIAVRGRERTVHSPAEARHGGLVSVYQEPSIIPDLDIRANLRLTETPLEPFRHWVHDLGLKNLDLSRLARRLPLASLRVIDLARALSIEPDVLMLDEITAALPANLTERVLEVIGRQKGGDRCIVFISHRLIEIAAVCDRATVLREGATVGVVDVTRGSEENIALPYTARLPGWGLIDRASERERIDRAVTRLQIDARAGNEVRRLSGGNQQKVTIARWVAGGVRTLLCFDPTRGIDIRTKNQIYQLLRELAAAGASVLLYTSELKEVQLACDRAIVIFGGRVIAELDAVDADEPALLRAAYNLRAGAQIPEAIAAKAVEATLARGDAPGPPPAAVAADAPADPVGEEGAAR